MKTFFQFITTPTADTPGTTIYLHFDDKRYLFGHVSEGTQRACVERGVRLSNVTDVFLTGKTSWANQGGLIGMILTLADAVTSSASSSAENEREKIEKRKQNPGANGKEKGKQKSGPKILLRNGHEIDQQGTVTIHGGANLSHTLATARRFVFRKGMPVIVDEFVDDKNSGKQPEGFTAKSLEDPTWTDEHIKVWTLVVPPSSSPSSSAASMSSSVAEGQKSPRKRSLDEFQEKGCAALVETPDQYAQDQLVRNAVVTEMFDSSWRMDSLVETPLADVQMPATLFVRNPETNKLDVYNGPKPGEGKSLPDIKVLVRRPWPGALVEKLPKATPSRDSICYIIRNHDVRGKFNPAKAIALNVPKGPSFSQLTQGQTVESTDGKLITPEMVLEPTRPGKGIAIIDLPSVEYVDNLVNRPEFGCSEVMKGLEVFVWILGPGVGSHPQLVDFVKRMSQYEHITSSPDFCPNYLSMKSASAAAIRLAKLDKDRFSMPVHDNETIPQPTSATRSSGIDDQVRALFRPAQRGLTVDLEPQFGINKTDVVRDLNNAGVIRDMDYLVARRSKKVLHHIRKPEFQEQLRSLQASMPCGDAEIVALGTGSSLPSKYRNVSATLLRVPGIGSYLLDAGENTLGQLKRVFPPEELRTVLQELRMIWISHLHADHHLGTVSMIDAWYKEVYGGKSAPSEPDKDISEILQEKRLFVVSDKHMIDWLGEYAEVDEFGYNKVVPLSASSRNVRGIHESTFHFRHTANSGVVPLGYNASDSPLTSLLQSASGLSDLLTCPVNHCAGAKAVSLVFPNGFKFSYSGDCRPSKDFAQIGRGSTVLLHEATFEDDMRGDALAKKHSTAGEAVEIGRQMRAQNVVLTHFSQRYQKLPRVAGFGRTWSVSASAQAPQRSKIQRVPDVPNDDPMGEGTVEDDLKTAAATAAVQSDYHMPVTVAFDYMRLRVKDIAVAQAYTPALMKMSEMEEMRDSTGSADADVGYDSASYPESMSESETEAEYKARQRKQREEAGEQQRGRETNHGGSRPNKKSKDAKKERRSMSNKGRK